MNQTDPTAAIEVWARMLCAADVHVHGDDHPTWQQLVGEPGQRIRDDYREAARWLLPRMTVAPKTAASAVLPVPPGRAASVCICGHTEQQHFEDVCITEVTGCHCGDFLPVEAAAEEIARLREIVRQKPPSRAAILLEAAAVIEAEQAREEATEWAQHGELDHETEIGGGYVRASAALLRRLAAEAQQQPEGAAPGEVLDLTDGPIRCPLCPNTVTLHTLAGARAHFTVVHPEQRLTGRGPGPWPRLVTAGAGAQQQPEPVSPAYVRLQAAAHKANEAAHLHAMRGMRAVFQLCRQYGFGNTPIPAAEVLAALGLDENANPVSAAPVEPAAVDGEETHRG